MSAGEWQAAKDSGPSGWGGGDGNSQGIRRTHDPTGSPAIITARLVPLGSLFVCVCKGEVLLYLLMCIYIYGCYVSCFVVIPYV